LSIFLCLCLRIFLRRFLITDPTKKKTSEVPEGQRKGEKAGISLQPMTGLVYLMQFTSSN
jgi:hypothetical protein